MNDFHIKNFADLHEVLRRYNRDGRWTFRGHSNPDWKLVPKVGRPPFLDAGDRDLFERWKRRAIEYVTRPPKDDWEWLAIAQHHGLATRLLDWTYNPLAAAFFAVGESAKTDAVIYAHKHVSFIQTDRINPMDVKDVAVYKPMGIVPRITRQGGLFTIHGQPSVPMENLLDPKHELERIVIDRAYRDELIFELSHYGVNRATLFPDLDGLSSFFNWVAASWSYSRN
jgi:FRG domain